VRLKYRLKNWGWAIRRWWYRIRHGIVVSLEGSMLPSLGKGKYVSVFRKGDYIEIHSHDEWGTQGQSPGVIRLIPYQPNHGVMVECVNADGKTRWIGNKNGN